MLLLAIGVMTLIGENREGDRGQSKKVAQTPSADRGSAAPSVTTATPQDSPNALYRTAQQYYYGRGVDKDYAKAVEMFRQAADAGHPEAQSTLGEIYATGEGLPRDDAEAVKWFRKAATQGDALAQFNVGSMYAGGRSVPKDDGEAVKWYRKAAQQGDEKSRDALRRRGLSW